MNVPEKFDRKSFVHPECCKKFAYAETLLNKRKSDQSSKRLKTSKNDKTDNRLFPNHCVICKSISVKGNGRRSLLKIC